MPMVRHHAVREKCDVSSLCSGAQDLLECGVVRVGSEKSGAFCRSIDDMKDEARRENASTSRHDSFIDATRMPSSLSTASASVLEK